MRGKAVAMIVLAGVVVAVLAYWAVALIGDMRAARRPGPPAGPLAVSASEIALPDPRGDRPLIPVRVWAPRGTVERALPLVLYVPGWGGRRGDADVMLSDIASFGFAVVAMDDVGHDAPDPATDAADEAVRTSEFRAFTSMDLAAFPDVSARRTRLARDKLGHILEALRRDPGRLPAPVDFQRVGVVGFSFGGAVAAAALAEDPRILAAVDLDGWVVHTPAEAGLARPFLALYARLDLTPYPEWLAPSRFHLYELARADFRALLDLSRSSSAEVLLIEGIEHPDFTDALYDADRWTRWRPWRARPLRPDRLRMIVASYLTDFLRQKVAGEAVPPRPGEFPEVQPIAAIAGELR